MAAFAMRADVRQEAFDAVKHAHQLTSITHRQLSSEMWSIPPQAAPALLHDMDTAERVECGLRRALDAFRVGHIADGAAYVGGDFLQAFDGGLQGIRLDILQHHFHAGLSKRPAERTSDTCSSAGHKGCLAGELSHGGSSRSLLA
jgi:hypothetical protein